VDIPGIDSRFPPLQGYHRCVFRLPRFSKPSHPPPPATSIVREHLLCHACAQATGLLSPSRVPTLVPIFFRPPLVTPSLSRTSSHRLVISFLVFAPRSGFYSVGSGPLCDETPLLLALGILIFLFPRLTQGLKLKYPFQGEWPPPFFSPCVALPAHEGNSTDSPPASRTLTPEHGFRGGNFLSAELPKRSFNSKPCRLFPRFNGHSNPPRSWFCSISFPSPGMSLKEANPCSFVQNPPSYEAAHPQHVRALFPCGALPISELFPGMAPDRR